MALKLVEKTVTTTERWVDSGGGNGGGGNGGGIEPSSGDIVLMDQEGNAVRTTDSGADFIIRATGDPPDRTALILSLDIASISEGGYLKVVYYDKENPGGKMLLGLFNEFVNGKAYWGNALGSTAAAYQIPINTFVLMKKNEHSTETIRVRNFPDGNYIYNGAYIGVNINDGKPKRRIYLYEEA